MFPQGSRQFSIDRGDIRHSRPDNPSLSIRQPSSSFVNRPPTHGTQRTTFNPPILRDSSFRLSQISGNPDVNGSRHVRFGSRDPSNPPGSSVRYSNAIPPGAVPAHQFNPNVSSRGPPQLFPLSQSNIAVPVPNSNIFAERHGSNPIVHQSIAIPHYNHSATLQGHGSYSNPPYPHPNVDVSHVIPVPVIPQGSTIMRNTALRTSGVRASSPLYMINNQSMQRPPQLSYIDEETTTCPVWIWALLGTLALIGIIATLVIVGKRDSGTFRITKSETSSSLPSNITAVNTTQVTTVTNETKIEPQKPPENLAVVENTTEVKKEQKPVLVQKNQTTVVEKTVQKTEEEKLKQQLIKQQNSTISDQQKEIDRIKEELELLKRRNTQTEVIVNTAKQVVSNPSTALPLPTVATPEAGPAIDVVECEPGYYPYGGICFPCKNGRWNGTNCIEDKIQSKQQTKEVKEEAKERVCPEGSFLKGSKCISCPKGSSWNGQNCVKKVIVSESIKQKQDKICPEGSFFANGQCRQCPPGLFWDGKGCFQKPLKIKHSHW